MVSVARNSYASSDSDVSNLKVIHSLCPCHASGWATKKSLQGGKRGAMVSPLDHCLVPSGSAMLGMDPRHPVKAAQTLSPGTPGLRREM